MNDLFDKLYDLVNIIKDNITLKDDNFLHLLSFYLLYNLNLNLNRFGKIL